MSCATCGAPNAKNTCGGCHTTRYCNEACQKAHWKAHRPACKAAAASAAAASAPPAAPPTGPFVLPAGAPCSSCGGDIDITVDGVKCGACFRVQYCNPACQKAHWPAHRAACGAALRARVWAGEGELGMGEVTLKKAMRRARRELGDDHEETLGHMATYALFLRQVGRYVEAEPLYREALSCKRRTLGDEHPHTLGSINNLANLLSNQGKLG
jgi:hypothetical protein